MSKDALFVKDGATYMPMGKASDLRRVGLGCSVHFSIPLHRWMKSRLAAASSIEDIVMKSTPVRVASPIRAWVIAALAAIGICGGSSAHASDDTPIYAQRILEGKAPVAAESGISQTGCCDGGAAPMITQPYGGSGGCSSCGGGSGECGNGCPTGKCKPGRRCGTCYGDFERPDECTGKCTRFWGNIFDCLCCPDPCYEPCWRPVANAAFFVDAARPHSQMRFRWDAGLNMTMPDRNEYFWAKIGGKGPPNAERSLNYHELTMYTETGSGAFSAFIEMPYRLVDPDINPYDAGWGDMNIGTKAMLVDCELLQFTFQFKTFIPIGSSRQGFGVGHVSLEPSLLGTLKLAPKTYLQTQLSEWIPIGGDPDYAGLVLHYHASLNHLLCCKGAFQYIATCEFSGYTFQDGLVTEAADWPVQGPVRSSRESYLYAGPGFRIVYCDKFDIGVGSQFSLTDDHFADQLFRTELRIRY